MAEIIADGDLSTKGIATTNDVEFVEFVGIALDEHGNIEPSDFERVSHTLFVAEVGQANEHAGDFIAFSAKEIGALTGVIMGLHATEFSFGRIEPDGFDTQFSEQFYDVGPGIGNQAVRKKITVAEDDTEGEGGRFHE